MTDEERNPLEVTQHLIRDWGILSKYRDYIRYWRQLLHKMGKQRMTRKHVKNQIINVPNV
jgi:hypothetical protein